MDPSERKLQSDLLDFVTQFEGLSRRVLRAMTDYGLAEAEARIIFALEERHQSQANLARTIAMDTGQVARTVASLRRKGLVQSYHSPLKPHEKLLSLTDSGRQSFQKARQRQLELVRGYLKSKSDSQILKLLDSCRTLGDHLWDREQGPSVRDAERGDIGLLIRLASETYGRPAYGGLTDEIEVHVAERFLEYRSARERGDGLFLVAEVLGYVVGGILMTGDRATQTARVELLAVEGEYQGIGAGTLLLTAAMNRLKDQGYRIFEATQPQSQHGPSFYHKHGWTLTKTRSERVCGITMTLEDWRY